MFLKKENGQTILEVALISAVLVLVIVTSMSNLRNSISSVFTKTIEVLNNEEQNVPDTELTTLGNTVPEISTNMIDHINAFYDKNGRYPRSWVDYAYTDIGLDPDEWRKKVYNGVIYKPNGENLRIRPGDGYYFQIKDLNGKTHKLPHEYNWDLVYRIPNDNKWYYHGVNGPVVQIETLEIIKDE
ncbi:MAG: Flp family type IVb pilin [Caldisericia bacterium]|nr:Flp family type IVb pilin [Caldisericia bacterium]